MTEAAQALVAPVLRPYCEDDLSFIIDSFVKSYWTGAVRYLPVSPLVYKYEQRNLILGLLKRPAVTVLVLCDGESPDVILGWIMVETGTLGKITQLHYLHVKQSCRGCGVARQLLKAACLNVETLVYTHITKVGRKIMGRYPSSIFNPWLLAARWR